MAAHTLSLSVPPRTSKMFSAKRPLRNPHGSSRPAHQDPFPKIDLIHQLKENLEHLLHHLFPDGPTGRDAKGFRFGAKGAFSVVCKGDKLGCFFDFENKTGGDILKLIQNPPFPQRIRHKRVGLQILKPSRATPHTQAILHLFLQHIRNTRVDQRSPSKSTIPPYAKFPNTSTASTP